MVHAAGPVCSTICPNPTTQPATPALPQAPVWSTKPALSILIPPLCRQLLLGLQSLLSLRFRRRPQHPLSSLHQLTQWHPIGLKDQPESPGRPRPIHLSLRLGPFAIAQHNQQAQTHHLHTNPFEIQFVDTKPGRQKSQVDAQGLLDSSDDTYQTIR
ncbi:hypothetical protein BDV93DRAFT_220670 [Ceratobasidium sp. AG-I]|nr:hypothetical protein BDV93DRAFT_220670 [Ceratobasidium sp. AG-I]